MQIGEYKFRLRLFPLLLLALPVPFFVALGLWQMDRAMEKRQQAETLNAREQMPPLQLGELIADAAQLRYRQVRVHGDFEPEQGFFIENRRFAGKTGFYVITPLRQSDSDIRVLINRGWVAADEQNQPPLIDTPTGPVSITGVAEQPSPPALALHQGEHAAQAWGKRWPYMTVGLYASGVDYPLQPIVILQNPGEAHGYAREWPREMPKEGMHQGYAIQWFAFALISLGLYIKLSLEKPASMELST